MMQHYLLPPPYQQAQPIASDLLSRIAVGTLLLIRPGHDTAAERVVAHVRECQLQMPYLTIGLWADLLPARRMPDVAARAGEIGVRGVNTRAYPEPAVLREQITDPSHLGHDLPWRLELLGFEIDGPARQFIRLAAGHERTWLTAGALIDAAGSDYRIVHACLARASLGTPAKLYQVLRLVRIGVEFQRHSQRSLGSLAREFGFWDVAHLRTRFRELFGIQPSLVRDWIGWECLLYWGLRRSGIRPPS